MQSLCLTFHALADEFIVPSNTAKGMSLSLHLGQTIQISWQTELKVITLLASHWGGNVVGSLLSESTTVKLHSRLKAHR